MSKRQTIIIVSALLVALVLFLSRKKNHDSHSAHYNAHEANTAQAIIDTSLVSEPIVPASVPPSTAVPNPMQVLMQTPIDFHGVVLDQNNQPVPTAQVNASVLDNMLKGSPIIATTGEDGKFTIKSRGMSLHVEVSKPGYHFVGKGDVLKPSSQGFDFGIDNGKGIHHSDTSFPAVFHLRRARNAVSLDRLVANPKIPRDGTPININISKTSSALLQVSCQTEENIQAPNAPYTWKCVVIVSGGGIQEAKNESDFTAPKSGYASSFVIDMPKNLDPKSWSSRANKKLWLRFADGTYAKLNFMMNARGDHFAVLDGYRNPTPDDRNLEPTTETQMNPRANQ